MIIQITGLSNYHSDGGPGSGNWGHAGNPGHVGGSQPGGGKQNRRGTKESGYVSPQTVKKTIAKVQKRIQKNGGHATLADYNEVGEMARKMFATNESMQSAARIATALNEVRNHTDKVKQAIDDYDEAVQVYQQYDELRYGSILIPGGMSAIDYVSQNGICSENDLKNSPLGVSRENVKNYLQAKTDGIEQYEKYKNGDITLRELVDNVYNNDYGTSDSDLRADIKSSLTADKLSGVMDAISASNKKGYSTDELNKSIESAKQDALQNVLDKTADVKDAEDDRNPSVQKLEQAVRKEASEDNISKTKQILSEVTDVGLDDKDLTNDYYRKQLTQTNADNVTEALDSIPKSCSDYLLHDISYIETAGVRANAKSWSGEIEIDKNGEDKTAIIHEMGHIIEDTDPDIQQAVTEFRDNRTTGESSVKLRDVTGNQNYQSFEDTKVDSFVNSYIGRQYSAGCTEVLSMGIQYAYSNPGALQADEEYGNLIYGILALQ